MIIFEEYLKYFGNLAGRIKKGCLDVFRWVAPQNVHPPHRVVNFQIHSPVKAEETPRGFRRTRGSGSRSCCVRSRRCPSAGSAAQFPLRASNIVQNHLASCTRLAEEKRGRTSSKNTLPSCTNLAGEKRGEVYVCGNNSSVAGLTAAVHREGGDFAVEAGALVLADP